MSDLITLETVSKRLGGIPLSTLKHRIQQLGIPAAARGSRNKLLFDERAVALLEASDQLMKEGHGLNTTRRLLKLDALEETAGDPATEVHMVGDSDEQAELSVPAAATRDIVSTLEHLADALTTALEQIAAKDRQIEKLQEDYRRAAEASATFQQKTFYLQGELQRLQGELKEARRQSSKDPGAWRRLFKREPDQP